MITIGLFVAVTATQRESANDVLAKSLQILNRASSVVGTFSQKIAGTAGTATGEFRLKKGAKLAVVGNSNAEICDGTFRMSIDKEKKVYSVRDVHVFELPYLPGFEGFIQYNGKSLVEKFRKETPQNRQAEDARFERLDGKQVVSYTIGGSKVFLDPLSALPVGADYIGENRKQATIRFTSIRLDAPVPDDVFKLQAAKDLREQRIVESGMLNIDQRIPISNLESMNVLSREMAGKRASIILFFDDKSAPSGEMLRKMFEISKKRLKDVAIIGVARTKNWRGMLRGRLNFTVIEDTDLSQDSIRNQFGITRYPSLYVVNQYMEATYVQIGVNDWELDPILRNLGFSIPQR